MVCFFADFRLITINSSAQVKVIIIFDEFGNQRLYISQSFCIEVLGSHFTQNLISLRGWIMIFMYAQIYCCAWNFDTWSTFVWYITKSYQFLRSWKGTSQWETIANKVPMAQIGEQIFPPQKVLMAPHLKSLDFNYPFTSMKIDSYTLQF